MLFRPTIGTWCKGTTFIGGTEKVVIAITCELLANYEISCEKAHFFRCGMKAHKIIKC